MELLGSFTSKGKALSAKLLMGDTLKITRVTAGDGLTPVEAAALERDCQALSVGTMTRSGTTVSLPVTLTAATAETDYTLKEVGVYAEDPQEGEILYRIYRLSQPVAITAGGQLTIRFSLKETVSEAANVTVSGAPAGVLTVADRGVPAGVASLDETGTVPPAQLPYTWGTADLEEGVSLLAPGRLYFVCAASAPSDGSGAPGETIAFTVGGASCTAESGMTWNDWIASDYNDEILGLSVNAYGVVISMGGVGFSPAVYGTDIIVSGRTYVFEEMGGGPDEVDPGEMGGGGYPPDEGQGQNP